MKKLSALVLVSLLLAAPAIGLAQEDAPEVVTTAQELVDLIDVVANWLFTFLLVIAVIMLIWAGLDFVTAGGDPERITGARTKIIYALVGVAVGVLARGLVMVIKNFLVPAP